MVDSVFLIVEMCNVGYTEQPATVPYKKLSTKNNTTRQLFL